MFWCRHRALVLAGLACYWLTPGFAQLRKVDEVWPGWQATTPLHILTPKAATPTGITPAQMRTAYGFASVANLGAGQVIGIVDAYDDPNIEADLGVFSSQFSLPACTTGNGCFQKIYASGTQPSPNSGWAGEISLDVEWAHAIAPQAKIILVEAASQSNSDLWAAVDVAVQNGATVVSMSFGGPETPKEVQADSHFNVPGVTFIASSGDSGHGAQYPAASPYVMGVGGTSLFVQSDGTYVSETAWTGSGGGTSRFEAEPSYQMVVQTSGHRTVPDISYDANPSTGVPIYDSFGSSGTANWEQVGGTSMSAPQWAALVAIVNSVRVGNTLSPIGTLPGALYSLTSDLNDIASGNNGRCPLQCHAGPGYDLVTGLGSPKANLLIPALSTGD